MKVLRITGRLYELDEKTTIWGGDDPVVVGFLNTFREELEAILGPADGDPRANIFNASAKRFDGTVVIDDEEIDQTERVY